jgi:hypothetical protein
MKNVGFGFTFSKENVDADGWAHNEWFISLEYESRFAVFFYYTGLAIAEPTFNDVIYSLRSDTYSGDMLFKEWCGEYGYDDDSIKALDVYDKCRANYRKLKDLFGDDYQWFLDASVEMLDEEGY